jgi:hypothetical protein
MHEMQERSVEKHEPHEEALEVVRGWVPNRDVHARDYISLGIWFANRDFEIHIQSTHFCKTTTPHQA